MHHLLLLIVYRAQLSKLFFLPQLLSSWVTWIYYNDTNIFYWFLIGEIIGVFAYMKFITGCVFPLIPENMRPKLLDWAANLIPASLFVLYVNYHASIWCDEHHSALPRMIKSAWEY